MKKLFYLIALVLCASCTTDKTPREGDIIFQTELNNEGVFIKNLTGSDITHCGIIIKKDDGTLHVLHMHNRILLTPLADFIEHGAQDKYRIARVTNKEIDIDHAKYIMVNKDHRYAWDSREFYNSELVYHIYKNDLGIELCAPRPLNEYHTDSTMFITNHNKTQQLLLVMPSDIYNSPRLKTIDTRYEE